MTVEDRADLAAARIAAAIGEPARARMLFALMDGRARTSTELAVIADVTPSTASIHLQRLKSERLIEVAVQGKHRYYTLAGPRVARTLESLNVLAGATTPAFEPSTPERLRHARTCYDHMAGTAAVQIHDRLMKLHWLTPLDGSDAYNVTAAGARALRALGVEVDDLRALRRRFAYACLDWSERRPHVGGAVGSALLGSFVRKRWVSQDLDTRALSFTSLGRRELESRFGLRLS